MQKAKVGRPSLDPEEKLRRYKERQLNRRIPIEAQKTRGRKQLTDEEKLQKKEERLLRDKEIRKLRHIHEEILPKYGPHYKRGPKVKYDDDERFHKKIEANKKYYMRIKSMMT